MTRYPPVGPSQAENALVSARATAISLLALHWVRLLSVFGSLHDNGRLAQFDTFLCRSYCLDVVAGLNDASLSFSSAHQQGAPSVPMHNAA